MKPIITYITCKDRKEADRIGRALVKEKLASCANIIPAAESIYFWNGKIQKDRESIILAKTFDVQFRALEQRVKTLHSYTTPCIIALPVSSSNKKYLAWSAEQLL
ncbi:divalent-cation tolerance protein CutA [Candidatus Woesearchaeota archaeon]|nr:MAG: divalent-cation tolerance protein CutA [Candidatus Woesearchaeota archaeon]